MNCGSSVHATRRQRFGPRVSAITIGAALAAVLTASAPSRGQIVATLATTSPVVPPTVPPSGDVNPYGVAFVPPDLDVKGGSLRPGDILVSNFNNSANQQGAGSSIVRVTPSGGMSVFFQGPAGLGLTTALGVLHRGVVVVGTLPTTYDSSGNVVSIGQGSLIFLDRTGHVIGTLTDATLLDGPWDLTVSDSGDHAMVFVSNVLNGTVTRLDLEVADNGEAVRVHSATMIGSGYLTRTDPAALILGPTGLAFDARSGVLFVASTGDNAIFAIPCAARRGTNAGIGRLVYQDNTHLHGPLGLVLAPNGHLISSQGDAVNPDSTQPSEIVEFTQSGRFVAQFPIEPAQGGAFGIALARQGDDIVFAAVDDIVNALDVWRLER